MRYRKRVCEEGRILLKKISQYIAFIYFLSLSSAGVASDTDLVQTFANMLAGEFESRNQMEEDLAAGVPDNVRHYLVNRSFQLVEAPETGGTLMVGTTEYHFGRWIFDFNEFLVWTLTPGSDGKSVLMSPKRFRDQGKRLPFARRADRLGGFTPEDLEAARGGASCDLVWTKSDNGFVGESLPCSALSTTKGEVLDWDWRLELTRDALWIEFNGRDETGTVLDGTEGMTPYRLDRLK